MLVDWIEAYGRTTQLFYAWLIQYDLVTDEYRQLAYAVMGTMIWQLVYQITSRTPDELPVDIIFDMATEAIYAPRQPMLIPLPTSHSDWQPFVLDEAAFRQAAAKLDSLVIPLVEITLDKGRF
ncbi:MAG: hypothetical protein ABI947_19330 [Chloroflexota bacterium]